MPGAPKGNKNALKHGLYASKPEVIVVQGTVEDDPSTSLPLQGLRRSAPFGSPQGRQGDGSLRGPERTIRYLEEMIDEVFARVKRAEGEEFTRLANTLSLAATSLFNGHRTVAYLTGGMTPVEDALKELGVLDFEED